MFEDIDLNAIHEEGARELIERLLNMVEQLSGELRDARAEIQRFRDEVNRLKGEQGQPKIKGNKSKVPGGDHSSEQERYKHKRHMKSSKKAEIHIDREELVDVDRAELPADAEAKGSEDVVVQDLLVHTDNVCFHKQKYYGLRRRRPIWWSCRKGTRDSLVLGSRP
jgi:dsDNA-specific endonuclease/ATPase MutS2